MAIVSKVISSAWQEGSGTAGKAYVVTKRLVSDTSLDFKSQTDLKTIRDAVGEPLDLYGTFSTSTVLGTMRIRSMQIVPVEPTVGKVFDCVITYGTEYMWAEIGSPGTPQLTLPVEVSFAATERTVANYRNKTFTTQPSANLNTTVDIGGTAVDEEGRPVEGRIASTVFGLSLVFDVSQTGKSLVGIYDDIDLCRGKWNSASFLHWSANQVVCTDADVAHIRDEFYRVTYRFRWDEWYDCEQVPLRDNDNVIKLSSSGKATSVYWRSINRSTANHKSIIFAIAPDPTLAEQMALEGSWLTYP
jgi:hypothetical protein